MLRYLALCVLTLSTSLAQVRSPGSNPIDGALTALDERGVNLSLQFYSDTLAGSPADSSAPHAAAFQFFDLSAEFDLGRVTPHLRHTRVYTSFHVNGQGGGDFDAASQSMIGITSPAGARMAELWLEGRLGNFARARAGKIDANPDFAFVNNGAGFVNSSFSYDPTFFTLPNYSNTAWGTELLLRRRSLHLNAAVFDPPLGTGALLMEEAGIDWEQKGWNGRAAVGAWQQTGTLPSFSGSNEKGARGYYIIGEQKFWRRERNQASPEQSLSAFVQLGSAPSRFSAIERHLGAGVVMNSPFASRADDTAGVSFTYGHLTRDPGAVFDYKYEMVVEATYTVNIRSGFSISPDLQYAIHPGGTASNRNAFAAGARVAFSLKPKSE